MGCLLTSVFVLAESGRENVVCGKWRLIWLTAHENRFSLRVCCVEYMMKHVLIPQHISSPTCLLDCARDFTIKVLADQVHQCYPFLTSEGVRCSSANSGIDWHLLTIVGSLHPWDVAATC